MLNVKLTKAASAAGCSCGQKDKAAAAWARLLQGAKDGENGFGWMNLPEADISGLVAMGQDLRKYSNIIVIGIGLVALVLYTGITRAKKILVLVGTRKALGYAVRNVTVSRRNTMLKERLRTISQSARREL